MPTFQESFTPEEKQILSRFFTNIDLPVFGLKNLPEVVKGALFARYSRSPKSIRRLFLDEFCAGGSSPLLGLIPEASNEPETGTRRAEELYDRIFNQYGDDSVAQLGGAHIACENASNVLTKILERGRLAAYLEQSTRYIRYDRKIDDLYRYTTPREIADSSYARRYESLMELLFDTYSRLVVDLMPYLEERFPKSVQDSSAVWRATINAKACDVARGLLPAATSANVGIFATGQAFEMLLIRMFAHPLQEVREYAELMLTELRKLVPSFMRRVDDEMRGRAWSGYLEHVAASMRTIASSLQFDTTESAEVRLVDWDSDGEEKIIAAALYDSTDAPDADLTAFVRTLSETDKNRIFDSYVGERGNRRHKPGRAFERISYRFDVLSDYGGFRDLQRHRMLTIEWQPLSTLHGYVLPPEIADLAAHEQAWHRAMAEASDLYQSVEKDLGKQVAQYIVPFAYRVRFMMQMNAREAFHLIELRSQRQGHPNYRRICQEMHRQIRDVAGHARVAAGMRFVDHAQYDLERLDAERRSEQRQQSLQPAVNV